MAKKKKQKVNKQETEPLFTWDEARPDFRWWIFTHMAEYETISRDQVARLMWFLIMESAHYYRFHMTTTDSIRDPERKRKVELFNARCLLTVCQFAHEFYKVREFNVEPDPYPLLLEIRDSAMKIGGPRVNQDL